MNHWPVLARNTAGLAVSGWSSTAPRSTRPLTVRWKPRPRWSNGRLASMLGLPAPMAGLPACKLIVSVGPPLLARELRFGLATVGAGPLTVNPGLLGVVFIMLGPV